MPKTARYAFEENARWPRCIGRVMCSALAGALLSLGAAFTASAQSSYGCDDLERSPVPMIEGRSGVFFRIDPDLLMDTRTTGPMIDSLAQITENLAARGTRLIYVPVPGKGLVQARDLTPDAAHLGYDARLAGALYADSLADLRSRGITAVDAVAALSAWEADAPPFFDTDPRMTDAGLDALARAVADEAGEDLWGSVAFTTTEGATTDLDSPDRFRLQLFCQEQLPPVSTVILRTQPDVPAPQQSPVAVVGSTITGGDTRNFPGFLAQALRRPVTQVVTGDSAFAAMTAYLVSEDFRRTPPEVIVWLVPIWENPSLRGDQPLREIIAAAANQCDSPRPATPTDDGGWGIDLAEQSASESLRLDTGGAPMASATFHFTTADGQTRSRHVIRQGADAALPVAFMPLSGLGPGGATHVTMEIDATPASPPLISVCRG